MAKSNFNKKNENSAKSTPIVKELPSDTELKVDGVKLWENGCTFNITINGCIKIFGCRVAEKKDGSEFVSFPQRKGNNGKYYNHVAIRLSKKQEQEVLDTVAYMCELIDN